MQRWVLRDRGSLRQWSTGWASPGEVVAQLAEIDEAERLFRERY
ncbi:hypothetical protein [Paractinoplanes globisporus]|uniref:Uncharacterized protein n=1 Tax=Paractinoplanes globisporus TaxID=113565 RepID=A0ABW6W923_9ACTN|nr:hypothetical protein [Actinoplanes globisporus]